MTDEYRNLASQIAQNASDAQASATNAQTSASNAQNIIDDAKTFANQTKTELTQIKTDTNTLKDEANTSAVNAKASEDKAKEYADNLQSSTDDISKLKEDITKVGTITECVAIVDGVEMSENVASVEFAFNAFEYRKVVIQIETKAASADAQILINCIVNNGKSNRELIRVPQGAISKNNRITVIEWYPTSTEGINIQTVIGHVVNTNISVIKTAKLYQSDMSKLVFSSVLGDAVIPAGTKFFIWGLR